MLELVFDGEREFVRVLCYCFVMKWTVICLWLKESV